MKAGGLRCVESFARTMVRWLQSEASVRADRADFCSFAETTDQTCQNERAATWNIRKWVYWWASNLPRPVNLRSRRPGP